MKTSNNIILGLILINSNLFAQNIFESIRKDYGFILSEKKWNIQYSFNRILNKEEIEILDKKQIEDFSNTITKYHFVNEKWSNSDVGSDFYIIKENQKLSIDSVKVYSVKNKFSSENEKKLTKQIKNYQNNINEWRHFPISISDIIYSSDKTLALVAINRGNDGGEIVVYRNNSDNWILIGNILGWSY